LIFRLNFDRLALSRRYINTLIFPNLTNFKYLYALAIKLIQRGLIRLNNPFLLLGLLGLILN
jgi:hypothetical protein